LDKHLFIYHRKYVPLHVYNVLHGNHKTGQTLWSFVNRLKHIRKANDDQLYNTNSQRTSNMLSNVFKCFMRLISLSKKHERLTYTHRRTGTIFFFGGGWAEFAGMTWRHRFRDVIIKLYNLRRLQMKGFPLKIDIKRNMSSLAISIIS
jgi:hypothetical protein